MTRIQRERFTDIDEYERLKDSYRLTVDKLKNAKPDMCILHPLPRVNEISVKVDDDKRACYFKQVENGKYMRMALILKLLEIAKNDKKRESRVIDKELEYNKHICKNPKCVSKTEQELDQIFIKDKDGNGKRCFYCDKEI